MLALAVPAAAESQDARLRVRLVDEGGLPVMGALVALMDAGNRVQVEGLSSEEGRRTLSAPPGSYTVRVRRIGFQPFVFGPVTLPFDGELRLTVESRRVLLDTVRVAARSRCRPASRDAEQLATVWEEVRKALRSSELSLDDLIGIGLARSYRREAHIGGGVVSSDTTTFVVRDRRPFGAADPAALAREGYVRGDVRRGWEFFGPDETVLLSDEFANTHCFRLVRERRRPGQIGVAFEPEPGRRTADIAGVLWVDETNAELREVRYRFVAGGVLRGVEAGGFTRFRRMPSGAWLVEEWQLRMPRLAIAAGAGEHIVAIGFVETGGGIVDQRTPSYGEATGTMSGVGQDLLVAVTDSALPGRDVEGAESAADTVQAPLDGAAPSHLRRGRARIAGTVVDDRGQAVAGARVSLEGAAGAAVTDAAGRFTLLDQPSGSGLLIVRKIGLSVAELPVALSAERVAEVSVRMNRQVPALAEVVVRARLDAALAQVGFLSRRARRGGNFFLDPEAMERRVNRYSLANILAEAPNLRYENGTVVGRPRGYGMPSGTNIPRRPPTCVRYLVDGHPWSTSGLDAPLAWLTPSDVAAIEVYWPGQAPPDLPNRGAVAYDDRGNPCEVVVLWTRHRLATR